MIWSKIVSKDFRKDSTLQVEEIFNRRRSSTASICMQPTKGKVASRDEYGINHMHPTSLPPDLCDLEQVASLSLGPNSPTCKFFFK